MPNPSNSQAMNAPVWDENTVAAAVVLTGGPDAVTIAGYYVIISNIGAANVFVSPGPAAPGVLVPPGSSFEIATGAGSAMTVTGTVGQQVVVAQFVGD